MTPDAIEKHVLLASPPDQVWRAVSDSTRVGRWFGAEFDGPFTAGTRLTARLTPTRVDTEIALLQAPHAGKTFDWWVESIVPGRRLAFRWHPFAVDPHIDYSAEPTTRVVFEIEPLTDGVRFTVTESGFDALPQVRRAAAWRAHDGGWQQQTQLLARYLADPAND
jgi:uncharacterized protein YndB with AHSA1/START domain